MGNLISFKKEYGLIVIGAIIFTASFLWKDLFLYIEDTYLPKENGLLGRLLFTIIVTAFLVLVTVKLKEMWGLTELSIPGIQFDSDPIRDTNINHDENI